MWQKSFEFQICEASLCAKSIRKTEKEFDRIVTRFKGVLQKFLDKLFSCLDKDCGRITYMQLLWSLTVNYSRVLTAIHNTKEICECLLNRDEL